MEITGDSSFKINDDKLNVEIIGLTQAALEEKYPNKSYGQITEIRQLSLIIGLNECFEAWVNTMLRPNREALPLHTVISQVKTNFRVCSSETIIKKKDE